MLFRSRPASTPPNLATGDKEETEEDRIAAELEVLTGLSHQQQIDKEISLVKILNISRTWENTDTHTHTHIHTHIHTAAVGLITTDRLVFRSGQGSRCHMSPGSLSSSVEDRKDPTAQAHTPPGSLDRSAQPGQMDPYGPPGSVWEAPLGQSHTSFE